MQRLGEGEARGQRDRDPLAAAAPRARELAGAGARGGVQLGVGPAARRASASAARRPARAARARQPSLDHHGAQASLRAMSTRLDRRRRGEPSPTSATRRPRGADAGDREDHDRPAGGPQRLPPAHRDRDLAARWSDAREDPRIGVIVLTGEGPDAFCSGGDQRVRGDSGYLDDDEAGRAGVGRFHVTDLHVQIRRTAQAGRGDGRGLRDRRRPRAAPRLRPDDRR